jgi:hypothetical protein
MKKTNINLLLSVCALLAASTLFAQEKQVTEAVIKNAAKNAGAKLGTQAAKKSLGGVEKKIIQEAGTAGGRRGSMSAFPSAVNLTKGARLLRVNQAGIKSAVTEAQEQAVANVAKAPVESFAKGLEGTLTPVERITNVGLLNDLSSEILGRLKRFIAQHGRYPRGKFFENGKEVTALNSSQLEEKALFEDAQRAMELMPNVQYTKEIAALKKYWTEVEGVRTEAEIVLDELDAFIRANGRYPQNHFGEEMPQLSAQEEVAWAKESILRAKIDRLVAENPNDVWVQEMQELEKDLLN